MTTPRPTTWSDYTPPAGWTRLRTIDAHTAGEPLRVLLEGFPEPPGDTILARRRHAREHADHLRRALMLEPRGHADMYGCLPMSPVTPDGDLGVLFLHNEGYSTMCGHGIIAMATVAHELGTFPRGTLRIDTPAGRVDARVEEARGEHGERTVTFENVPSFVLERDARLDVPGVGAVRLDLAYGGAFYAIVELDALACDLSLDPASFAAIVDVGMRIKREAMKRLAIRHPSGDADLNFLYGTILVDRDRAGVHSRNVCVFADGEVDRSPTGTGVSARAAVHHAGGELALGDWITIESLIGTRFDVRCTRAETVGGLAGVVPEVRGSAFLTGRHEFWIDPADPLREGVLLR